MALQLSSHFVAFVDLLGFSEMVRADCESSHAPKFLEILHEAHLRAAALFGKNLEGGLTQFSDSIVLSRPFDLNALPDFVSSIAEWQRGLLNNGLLCRGGVTFGKHFVKDRFLFSKGLIDAYHLESTQAKFPRIVLSENLLQLAVPTIDVGSLKLLREEDGVAFIDYLAVEDTKQSGELAVATETVIKGSLGGSASVQEKMRWLARYADFRLGTKLSGDRFSSM